MVLEPLLRLATFCKSGVTKILIEWCDNKYLGSPLPYTCDAKNYINAIQDSSYIELRFTLEALFLQKINQANALNIFQNHFWVSLDH